MAKRNQGQQQQGAGEGDDLELPNNVLMMPQRLGEPDDENLDLIDGEPGDGDDDDPDPYAQLEERFESLQQQMQQNQEYYQNLILQMATENRSGGGAGQQSGGQGDAGASGLNLDDLPDPVEKREDFNKELGKRINGYLTQQQQATQTTTQLNQQLQDLDNRFRRDYADIADKSALFQTATQQEVQRMRSMGLDPKRAIFIQPDKFLKDVANRMYSELGIDPDARDDDDDDEGGNGQQMQQQRRQTKTRINKRSANRTGGVSRGSRPGGGAANRGGKKKASGFVDQIKQQQLEEGLL